LIHHLKMQRDRPDASTTHLSKKHLKHRQRANANVQSTLTPSRGGGSLRSSRCSSMCASGPHVFAYFECSAWQRQFLQKLFVVSARNFYLFLQKQQIVSARTNKRNHHHAMFSHILSAQPTLGLAEPTPGVGML
jgi:hypothetical protein